MSIRTSSRFGQLDDAAAVDGQQDRDEHAADEQRRLEVPAAADDRRDEHGRGDERPDLHVRSPGRSDGYQGSTATGRGSRPLSATAADRARSTSANSPTTVGPDPQTSAWSAPAPRTSSSVQASSGTSETRGRLEVVEQQVAGRERRARGERGDEVGAARLEGRAGPRQPQPVGLAVDVRGRRAGVASARRGSRTARVGQRVDVLAGAGRQVAPRAHLRRHVGAERRGDLAQQRVVAAPRRRGRRAAAPPPRRPSRRPCRRRPGSACR